MKYLDSLLRNCLVQSVSLSTSSSLTITGPATLKYRSEESKLAKQANPKKYNDEVIWPDKVRINRYYLHHHTFLSDIKMILCTVSGKTMMYNNEKI